MVNQATPAAYSALEPNRPEIPQVARRQVLVIDDVAIFRATIRSLLSKWGYEPVLAASGSEGLAQMESSDIGLVICDWEMDGMSGPEVCAAIRARDYGHYVYVLMLTGRTENTDLVYGLESGADDFVPKPFDAQALRARLKVGVRILELEERLAEQNRHLQAHHDALSLAYYQIQNDLASAARIQRELLPTSDAPISPLRASWLFLPAAKVSGDSFSFYPLSADLIAFYQLDVSGHGIPAALLSTSLSRALVPCASTTGSGASLDPQDLLCKLNRDLLGPDGVVSHYATMVFGLLDRFSGEGRLAVAGHPRPLALRADGRIDSIEGGGLPIGMFETAAYDLYSFRLEPGDRLILYSDGVTDCFSPSGQGFDVDRLRAVLARESGLPAARIADALKQALSAWRGGADLEDDISVLIIERPAEPSELRLHSDPADLSWYAEVQGKLQRMAAAARLEGQRAMLLPLAVVEAINNVIEHAYDNRLGHPIYLHMERSPSSLVVTLRDRGMPMPSPLPGTHPKVPDSSSESGRGWLIIRSVFPDVRYRRKDDENELTLVCPLDPPEQE